MIIYKITNKINNKIYIGQTINTLQKRWNSHCNVNKKSCISNAIQKYGKENFTVEEIDGANSLSELNYLEQHYIYIYNSLSPNGYNIQMGGDNFKRVRSPMSGKKHSEETKLKMSKASIGKKKSNEARLNMSRSKIGKKLPKITRDRMSKARAGIKKAGRCLISEINNKSFKSICEASCELKIARRTIHRWLKSGKNSNIIKYKE